MRITTEILISPAGKMRIKPKNGRPQKGEIAATLLLDVPDSAFQPTTLTLRASVAQPTPITSSAETNVADWTPERIRRVMAVLGLSREELARRVGVTAGMVRDWESGTVDVGGSAARKLAALETQTKGVTA